jgi:hypothetical protein
MKEEHEDSGNSKKSKDQVPKAKRITALVHEKGSPFARIPVDGHLGIWPCQGDHFRDWLASLLWKHEGKAAGSEAIGSALSVLRSQATRDGEEFTLHNRVARGLPHTGHATSGSRSSR